MRLLPLFPACLFMFLLSCNQSAPKQENGMKDSSAMVSKADSMQQPEFAYEASMEPLTVGAQFAKKLQDTLGIKLYEFTVKPGDSVALHKHPDHVVYVLQGGKVRISFNGAPPQEMEFKAGTGFVSPSLSDAGMNIGKTTIKLVIADIYRNRPK